MTSLSSLRNCSCDRCVRRRKEGRTIALQNVALVCVSAVVCIVVGIIGGYMWDAALEAWLR